MCQHSHLQTQSSTLLFDPKYIACTNVPTDVGPLTLRLLQCAELQGLGLAHVVETDSRVFLQGVYTADQQHLYIRPAPATVAFKDAVPAGESVALFLARFAYVVALPAFLLPTAQAPLSRLDLPSKSCHHVDRREALLVIDRLHARTSFLLLG